MSDNEAQTNGPKTEAVLDALLAQTAAMTELVDAYAGLGRAAAGVIRSTSAARARPVAPPPPVSSHLQRFTTELTDKIIATAAQLTEEHRARLGALVPAFTQAALQNEPDVIAKVTAWLDLAPDEIARSLVSELDELERRFAA